MSLSSPRETLDLKNQLRASEKEVSQLREELQERSLLLQKTKVRAGATSLHSAGFDHWGSSSPTSKLAHRLPLRTSRKSFRRNWGMRRN